MHVGVEPAWAALYTAELMFAEIVVTEQIVFVSDLQAPPLDKVTVVFTVAPTSEQHGFEPGVVVVVFGVAPVSPLYPDLHVFVHTPVIGVTPVLYTGSAVALTSGVVQFGLQLSDAVPRVVPVPAVTVGHILVHVLAVLSVVSLILKLLGLGKLHVKLQALSDDPKAGYDQLAAVADQLRAVPVLFTILGVRQHPPLFILVNEGPVTFV